VCDRYSFVGRAALALATAIIALGGLSGGRLGAETTGVNLSNTGGAGEDKTVWSGVYTPEQARNGKASYAAACSACHQESLGGDTMSPALVGEDFRASWDSQKLRKLYSRILSTMPVDNPGTLTEKTVLDIVAYLLEANGFPGGTAALERADDLNTILFLKQK
jgi:mono/diheme cytochrome c family protein